MFAMVLLVVSVIGILFAGVRSDAFARVFGTIALLVAGALPMVLMVFGDMPIDRAPMALGAMMLGMIASFAWSHSFGD